MDAGKVTALTLHDLSAAFDTIDRTIVLRRLHDWSGLLKKHSIGLNDTWLEDANGLSWVTVLQGWSHFLSLSGVSLSPRLYTLYTTPLSKMLCGHAIPHHLCADDSQLYVSFASRESAAALNGLQSCLAYVYSWMLTNKLKLKRDKTEFLLIGNE